MYLMTAMTNENGPVKVESVTPKGGFPVRFDLMELIRIGVIQLVIAGVTVGGLLWGLSVQYEHRFTALESRNGAFESSQKVMQEALTEAVRSIRDDIRELRRRGE